MSDFKVGKFAPELPAGAQSELSAKTFERITDIDAKLLKESQPIYVYNIYDMSWDRNMGIFGNHFIGAVETHGSSNREQWEPYRLSRTEQSYMISYDVSKGGEGFFDYKVYNGFDFVQDLLYSKSKGTNNLENWGCFYSLNNPPTNQELAKAQEKLMNTLHKIVADGDILWNGTNGQKNSIGTKHKKAAAYLKVTREWMRGTHETMKDCPWCGKVIKNHAALCDGCGRVVDNELFNKLQEQFGSKEETIKETPKLGRPSTKNSL